MTKPNEENERIKRRYLTYLREARRCSEPTVDAAAAAIDRFAAYLEGRGFKTFHRERAVAFKRWLAQQPAAQSGKLLSQSTLDATLRALVTFFTWLADQPGYKSKFGRTDAEHFNLSLAEARAGRGARPRKAPTLDQVHRVLAAMPCATEIEKRNQALVAMAILTGARDGALRTLRLKHLKLAERQLDQDPREVATKFSKLIITTFFPVGGEAEEIVRSWAARLTDVLGRNGDDVIFPATRMGVGGDGAFGAIGLERRGWATTTPIRKIFRDAFAQVGLPYFHPHSFRHTLAVLGTTRCRTPEEMKAWSQNLGHDDVLTTFNSYGSVPPERQAAIICGLGARDSCADEPPPSVAELLRAALRQVQ